MVARRRPPPHQTQPQAMQSQRRRVRPSLLHPMRLATCHHPSPCSRRSMNRRPMRRPRRVLTNRVGSAVVMGLPGCLTLRTARPAVITETPTSRPPRSVPLLLATLPRWPAGSRSGGLSRRANGYRLRWLPGPLHSLGTAHLPITQPRTRRPSREVVVVNAAALASTGPPMGSIAWHAGTIAARIPALAWWSMRAPPPLPRPQSRGRAIRRCHMNRGARGRHLRSLERSRQPHMSRPANRRRLRRLGDSIPRSIGCGPGRP